jgi:hypothetical protein
MKHHAGSLLGSFFDPDSGGNVFLWNIGWLSTDYVALCPKDRTLHNHCCENLKCCLHCDVTYNIQGWHILITNMKDN